MIRKHSISLLLVVFIIGISCKNSPSTDVNANAAAGTETTAKANNANNKQTSVGYFSCKVDGVLLEALYPPGTAILFSPAKKEVNIWGKTETGFMSIIMDNVESTGTFTIKGNSKNGAGIMSGTKIYEVKKTGTPFTVTIATIDEITAIDAPEAKAISGTFEGKLMDQDGNIVEITEGKFSTQ